MGWCDNYCNTTGSVCYVTATSHNYWWYSNAIERPPQAEARGGQGSWGWRNFKRCLIEASLTAVQPLAVKARPIGIVYLTNCSKDG